VRRFLVQLAFGIAAALATAAVIAGYGFPGSGDDKALRELDVPPSTAATPAPDVLIDPSSRDCARPDPTATVATRAVPGVTHDLGELTVMLPSGFSLNGPAVSPPDEQRFYVIFHGGPSDYDVEDHQFWMSVYPDPAEYPLWFGSPDRPPREIALAIVRDERYAGLPDASECETPLSLIRDDGTYGAAANLVDDVFNLRGVAVVGDHMLVVVSGTVDLHDVSRDRQTSAFNIIIESLTEAR
jgi:hypothetical protein